MKKTEKKMKAIVPEVVEGGTYTELVNAIGRFLNGLGRRSRPLPISNW